MSSSPAEPAHVAIREGLEGFFLAVSPETARAVAVACLRLAAGMVALAGTLEGEGARGAAAELLLMLAEGPPELADAAA